jgi:hypothetical protein
MEITSISSLLVSIKTATDIAKLIKESDTSLEKAESKLKLAELISALADAKIEVADIQQVILDKDAEIRGLHDQLKIKAKVQWDKPYYWLIDGTQKDGPFCQHCYDKNQQLIRLQGNGEGYWDCKACKNGYADSTHSSFLREGNYRGHNPFDGF